MKWSRSKRVAAVLAAVVLALFLFRPGVYRLRNRISLSIGNTLGRQVSIDNVHLHILPRPGFDLEGLTIYDDPEFSAEPMIRAGYVLAAIRVRSLLRGRLEIGSLSANYPSINLVRNEQGRWNFSALLERNAQIPAAPTDKRAFQRQPIFPYLEASHARVNFKAGAIKKSYALMDADLSFWQDAENSWSARLKAVPVRTDFNMTDTGVVTMEGKWQRASTLAATPLQFSVQWQNGQLGQITKLFSGNDRGWRGDINFSAKVSGTLEALALQSDARIAAFHRYDIAVRDNVRLSVKCAAQYNALAATASGVVCESPVGEGQVRISGSLGSAFELVRSPTYDLTIAAEDLPIASMLRLFRQAKKNVPAELTAEGTFNARFHAARLSTPQRAISVPVSQTCSGGGTATQVHLSSPKLNPKRTETTDTNELLLASIPVELSGCNDSGRARLKSRAAMPSLRIGPATLSINASGLLNVGGSISADGYQFFLRGDSTLRDVFSLEDVLGIPGIRPTADGLAKLDVGVTGGWHGFSAPVPSGGAQLRSVHAVVRWMDAPLEISSATVAVDAGAVNLQKIVARIGATNLTGRVRAPRHCAATTDIGGTGPKTSAAGIPACQFQFDLSADSLASSDLSKWFSPRPAKRPWYRVLDSNSDRAADGSNSSSPLLAMQATGSAHVGLFMVGGVTGTQWSSNLDIDRGKITLTGLSGEILHGSHHGNWVIDLNHSDTASGPKFRGTGTLTNVLLDRLKAETGDSWITGSANGTYVFSGADLREPLHNSEAKLKFVMRNGNLPQVELHDSQQALRVQRFTGELILNAGQWLLTGAKLESQASTFVVSGTATSQRDVNFTLTGNDDRSWSVTGSLAEPHVAQTGISPEMKRTEADVKAAAPQVEQ